jgi:hypothetical protein
MSQCRVQEADTIALYFYGELEPAAEAGVTAHLGRCRECAQVLEELHMIRAALSERADVAGPACGEWTAFMQRLDAAVRAETSPRVVPFARPVSVARRPYIGLLAAAALLALVTVSVFMGSRAGRSAVGGEGAPPPSGVVAGADDSRTDPAMQAALTSVGLRHLERSKLVVLGLAAKEPAAGGASDWAYERELASALLNDTRLYRQAAEQRGLTSLVRVMRDLELVLLQTSMAEVTDTAALPQIQRLIHKRGLVEKMDVAGTTGLLP